MRVTNDDASNKGQDSYKLMKDDEAPNQKVTHSTDKIMLVI